MKTLFAVIGILAIGWWLGYRWRETKDECARMEDATKGPYGSDPLDWRDEDWWKKDNDKS